MGRSREGTDCWGLVCLVYAGELGLELPSYADRYTSAAELAEVNELIRQEGKWPWAPVALNEWPDFQQRVRQDIKEFDLLVLRRGACEGHIGISIGNGFMLHVSEGLDSCVESFMRGPWSHRLTGAYRYAV